ncbi:unnamed protein product [Mesocestoides corti]|uniref:Cytosol aminopeptidase domain-containing protein n=1 Tax=Mesocestoides corti TaxID=53468 RepID=A0A0R3ULG5_MESCO|nr:unnamed protein product [Mesocestoides corti]
MTLVSCSSIFDATCDVVVFVNDAIRNLGDSLISIEKAIADFEKINPRISESLELFAFPDHPCKRLIFSPTGKLNGDTDDSRNISDAAFNGLKKVVSIGCRKPLLVLGPLTSAPTDAVWTQDDFPLLNAILGSLHCLYNPLELREAFPEKPSKFDLLSVFGASEKLLNIAYAIEEGRRVSRDIAASDPERMAAPRIVEYIYEELGKSAEVSLTVTEVGSEAYPLMAAVNRAASGITRHNGKVVHMVYEGSSHVDTSLYLVGKGITFDTGGCDVKAGGVMAGMHRDKSGAAAIAGFFKTLSLLKPTGLRVCGSLALVRNSIGSNGYVADEIITSRAGRRIRIGNTDAEGRMALNDVNPFIFTVATLTGHVVSSYKCYTAVMDNGPARKQGVAKNLQRAGERVSDMTEISTVRREDFEFVRGRTEYEDLLQCNNKPSSLTPRGHQFPAAFMIVASGLDEYGLGCEKQLPYTHIDIAGGAGLIDTLSTGSPLMMFTSMYVLPRL